MRKHSLLISLVWGWLCLLGASAQAKTLDPTFKAIFAQSDATFNARDEANGKVSTIGKFTFFDDQPLIGLSRLIPIPALVAPGNLTATVAPAQRVYLSWQSNSGNTASFQVERSLEGNGKGFIKIAEVKGSFTTFTDEGLSPSVTYHYRVRAISVGGNSSYGNEAKATIPSSESPSALIASFHPLLKGEYPMRGNNGIYAVATQSDGKVLIGGIFSFINGVVISNLARLNADGTVDPTFSTGIGPDAQVLSLGIQSDGKIVIAGWFTKVNGRSKKFLARLNTDGSLDEAFANDNIGTAQSILVQDDDRILVSGFVTGEDGITRQGVARLNANGTTDESFTIQGYYVASAMALLKDGKILVAGSLYDSSFKPLNNLIRLNPDGSLDNTFNVNTGAAYQSTVYSIAVLKNNQILIGGNFTSVNGTNINQLARLNEDGTLDPSFDPGAGIGGYLHFRITSLFVQPDDKIIASGIFISFNNIARNNLARLNNDGSLDQNFNTSNWPYSIYNGANNSINAVALQSDGNMFVGGQFTSYNGVNRTYIAKLNSVGVLDQTFNVGIENKAIVYSITAQSDGKVLVAGSFTSYNGVKNQGLVRLNSDDSVDDTFDTGQGNTVSTDIIHKVVVQPDGKILVAGLFNSYNGVKKNGVARLNADGSMDETFIMSDELGDPYSSSSFYALALQEDGKILIGGYFSSSGNTPNYIARLNADGSLDHSFNIGTGANSTVLFILYQKDGKIIVGGWFDSFNGQAVKGLVRLHADGSIDQSFIFNQQVSSAGVGAGQLLADGKILIGGRITFSSRAASYTVVRLNADGGVDSDFIPLINGYGINKTSHDISLRSLTLLPDGKILIGGYFSYVKNYPVNNIARLNRDGSVDVTFNAGQGADQSIITMYVPKSGNKVWLGGDFLYFDGQLQTGLAQLALDQTSASCTATGSILREFWSAIPGNSISDIPLLSPPTQVSQLTSFAAPSNVGDFYGQRLRGYICAPQTGKYTFWIAGDNDCDLYLSTDENPAKKVKIAFINGGYAYPGQWKKFASQQSSSIYLEKGKRYYVEALHKEGYGSDNLAVGWQLPDGTMERPISGSRLSPFIPQYTPCQGAGGILREYWSNVRGAAVNKIPLNTAPKSSEVISSFEGPSNVADNYGARYRGYLCPPADGQYLLYLASDNDGELWLSSDETPANKVKVAFVEGVCKPRQWTKYVGQKSIPIELKAGHRYYIEALHKEEYGSDNLAVGWKLANTDTKPFVIAGSQLSPYANVAARLSAEEDDVKEQPTPQLVAQPNPFTDKIQLSFQVEEEQQVILQVYDVQGRVVASLHKGLAESGQTYTYIFEGSNLKAGIYIGKLSTQKGMVYQKLLLTR